MTPTKKIIPFKDKDKPATSNRIFKVIGLMIVAFAVLGLLFSSLFSGFGGAGREELNFGRYGNKKISYRYDNSFGRAVTAEMAEYEETFSSNNELNQNQAIRDAIRHTVWQRGFSDFAMRTAMNYHLEEAGYRPSIRAMDRQMSEIPAFQTNGRFDSNKYNEASQRVKNSYRGFLMESQIYTTWYEDAINSLYRSEAELGFLQDMQAATRTYDYITLPFQDYPESGVITYARENPLLFNQRTMSRVTVEDEQTAIEVMRLFNERKQNIGAFAALAQEYSIDTYKDDEGSMGIVAYHTLLETLQNEDAESVFATSTGEITDPIKTDFGWMIFHTDDEIQVPNPEDITEEVREYMLHNEAGLIEDSLLARTRQLREKAIRAESFYDAMAIEGLEISTTEPFPFNFGGDSLLGDAPDKTDDSMLIGTTSSEEFWNNIVALKTVGEISHPIVLSNAIGIFTLASVENADAQENWDSIVRNEFGGSIFQDFQSIFLDEESKLFNDNFSETYNSIFR